MQFWKGLRRRRRMRLRRSWDIKCKRFRYKKDGIPGLAKELLIKIMKRRSRTRNRKGKRKLRN